jgi:hypothetical protein
MPVTQQKGVGREERPGSWKFMMGGGGRPMGRPSGAGATPGGSAMPGGIGRPPAWKVVSAAVAAAAAVTVLLGSM